MEQPLPADAGAARRGEQLVARLECRGCHRVAGTGQTVGPDLANAGRRLKPGWIVAWLTNPQKWRPGTLQPELDLKLEEVRAIAAYLMTQTGVPVGARPVPAATR
jgi:cytochrome c oxidase subunit 2